MNQFIKPMSERIFTPYVLLWPFTPFAIWLLFFQSVDNQAWFLRINTYTSNYPDILWTGLSLFGNGWALFALTLPLLLVAPKNFYACLISGLCAALTSMWLKSWADTPRPAGIIDHQLFHLIDQPLLSNGMPSGHTMTAFTIAFAILYTIPKIQRSRWYWLILPAIAAGLSRIAVGAHWVEDVLIGSAVGMCCGLIGPLVINLVHSKYLALSAWPAKVVLLASIFCLYMLIFETLDFLMNRPIQNILVLIVLTTWMIIARQLIQIKKSS